MPESSQCLSDRKLTRIKIKTVIAIIQNGVQYWSIVLKIQDCSDHIMFPSNFGEASPILCSLSQGYSLREAKSITSSIKKLVMEFAPRL